MSAIVTTVNNINVCQKIGLNDGEIDRESETHRERERAGGRGEEGCCRLRQQVKK